MLLAGDLGGTKTLLGLYEPGDRRPHPVVIREFVTLAYDGLTPMIEELFATSEARGRSVTTAVMGVAGPVLGQSVQLTNVPWRVDAVDLARRTGMARVILLNDVEAMAHSVEALEPDERVVLQEGARDPEGNGALLSIGTGVGMALLHRVRDHFAPLPSEGGHADFAARTDPEIALVRALRPKYGRVDIERVVSGRGLARIARFTHGGACPRFPEGLATQDEPAEVTQAALDGTCRACSEALDLFVEAMAAVAGNLVLTTKATGGLFIGGGVPPKILPALKSGRFISTFVSKAPVAALVQAVPVTVITNTDAGLLGAAVCANRL